MKASVRNTRKQGRHHVEVELNLTPQEIAALLEHGKLTVFTKGKTIRLKEEGAKPKQLDWQIPDTWIDMMKDQINPNILFEQPGEPGLGHIKYNWRKYSLVESDL